MSDLVEVKAPVKKGRPSKAALAKKNPVGRPKSDTGRLAELKARLMATAGNKVLDTIVKVAQDPDHPNWVAAAKMCIDRQLPLSMFEKDAKGRSNAVTINIVGAGNTTISSDPVDAEDVDYEDVAE